HLVVNCCPNTSGDRLARGADWPRVERDDAAGNCEVIQPATARRRLTQKNCQPCTCEFGSVGEVVAHVRRRASTLPDPTRCLRTSVQRAKMNEVDAEL